MHWENFNESEREYPEKIVEEFLDGFEKATRGLVSAKVYEISDVARVISKIPGDFIFNVKIFSSHIEGYSFKVFSFSYDVDLSKITCLIESSIYSEIEDSKKFAPSFIFECKTDEEFKNLLSKVFKTKKFSEIVSGIMKIARKNLDKNN